MGVYSSPKFLGGRLFEPRVRGGRLYGPWVLTREISVVYGCMGRYKYELSVVNILQSKRISSSYQRQFSFDGVL